MSSPAPFTGIHLINKHVISNQEAAAKIKEFSSNSTDSLSIDILHQLDMLVNNIATHHTSQFGNQNNN